MVATVDVAGWLMLEDGVGAGSKIVKTVAALGVGVRGGELFALLVEQVDLHPFEQNVVRADVTIPFGIGVDLAADRAGEQFAKVVVHALLPAGEDDIADFITRIDGAADRRAFDLAGGVFAVEPAARLHFHDLVGSGHEVLGLPKTIGVGEDADRAGFARHGVERDNIDSRVGDAFFAGVAHAVVVAVMEDVAAQFDRLEHLLGRGDGSRRAVADVFIFKAGVLGQAERAPRRSGGLGKIGVVLVPEHAIELNVLVVLRGELAANL